MDCRLDDSRIVPLKWRFHCDLKRLPVETPWPIDHEAVLAYSDAEREAIAAALNKAKVPYTIEPVDQPDPTLLAACQGKVRSRSEALAALAAGKPPLTLSDFDVRLQSLEAKTAK